MSALVDPAELHSLMATEALVAIDIRPGWGPACQ